MLHKERIKRINDQEIQQGDYVLYWMQNAQRVEFNHALEFAIEQSNRYGKPILVYFGLTANYPEANTRHFAFLLEGLMEVRRSLEKRGIRFLIQKKSPEEGAIDLAQKAVLVVVDKGYLRLERQWRKTLGEKAPCSVIEVETNLMVPVASASPKEEYSAATLRKKISPQIPYYNQLVRSRKVYYPSLLLSLSEEDLDLQDKGEILKELGLDLEVSIVEETTGGTSKAMERLEEFIQEKLEYYHRRNEPGEDFSSGLSPYLHFGQISPLVICQKVSKIPGKNSETFLEELIIRRELAFNFVYYNQLYDDYQGLPDWTRKTLGKHKNDPREIIYDQKTLESAATHDPYWNAAQEELVYGGMMHNYMRMYWGKKILEWSATPEEAFGIALRLNNKYALDGRDANSFAGIAWCFGKHDRPWQERPIFGMIRYMNAQGLDRKFTMEDYLTKVSALK